ncbi:unnamed protein product [Brassicogethes aeneus]|uniref:Protein inscuteable homologue C-terminal domain-containing protein n=1 Tax=Brassicogethes aeneus TaxID=1431903 RepID=A0A9P0FER3_BRAAE|nr:unnamed protein product [Brassicogethes aeneus]
MGEFKRSPSKVWWGNESLEWREISASPGSQDSGFSDSENSPHNQHREKESPSTKISKDIYKELSSKKKSLNLIENFKEKVTPDKILRINTDRLVQTEVKNARNRIEIEEVRSEPRRNRYTKYSPKVSRNLFNTKPKDASRIENQYSNDVSEETTNSNDDLLSSDSFDLQTQSLPIIESNKYLVYAFNKSAPAELKPLRDDECVTSFNNSLSSDCESELECLFDSPLESPKHTSTPKSTQFQKMINLREKMPLDLYLKYQQRRVPPICTETDFENKAVEQWIKEAKYNCEQECMSTLQCKSIIGDLNQRVSQLATCATENIRAVLKHARCIEMEYQNLNSETMHLEPLIQSLAGNILEFLKAHTRNISSDILILYDDIKKPKNTETLKQVSKLFTLWQDILNEILTNSIKTLVDNLEYPKSDLDLRATVTGITSVALRNEELIEMFTKADIIPILLILCEKCEGSSLRTLLLRALSTMCSNTKAVRQFEKYSGVQIIADTLDEECRPEPERSEVVALLAQVTAPWIEDNHSVKGLVEYSRSLVKSLTKFASATKCCQNLLLCVAATANLSSMDNNSVKYMIQNNTVEVYLRALKTKGSSSIYLLEQLATLIANMSAIDAARSHLSGVDTAAALLYFLQACRCGEDIEKRLQQKTMIALSRLCGDADFAKQVVKLGGTVKLVYLCREKKQRYDSDAVLVAALATLRKIADVCGSAVLSAQDAQELVEPKLLDSFLAYSTQNESYV